MISDQPLVTLIVIAYNQQEFVVDAIKAALIQTYAPLEVIISDDCSSDGTWQCIQQVASDYSGEHTIVLNRNEKNLGIAKHVDYLCRKAKGVFIVLAPGDDISYPTRVKKVVDAWISHPKQPSIIYSNAVKIDSDGNECGRFINSNIKGWFEKLENPYGEILRFYGCTSGFDRKIYELFPSISENIICEDAISFHRAHLMRGVLYIPDIIVKYRLHDNASSQLSLGKNQDYVATMKKWRRERLARIAQYKKDVQHFSPPNISRMMRSLDASEKLEKDLVAVLERNIFLSSYCLIKRITSRKSFYTKKEILKMFLFRWRTSLMMKKS